MKWGMAAFLILGLAMLVAGVGFIGYNSWFWLQSEPAQGIVLSLSEAELTNSEKRRQGRGTSIEKAEYLNVEFQTDSGKRIRFKTDWAGAKDSYSPGDEVSVIYQPDNPQDAKVLGFKSLVLGPLLLMVMGAIFGAIGGVGWVTMK